MVRRKSKTKPGSVQCGLQSAAESKAGDALDKLSQQNKNKHIPSLKDDL